MLMDGRAIVDRIELNDRDAETSVELRNALGRLACRVALYLTGLEKKASRKRSMTACRALLIRSSWERRNSQALRWS